MAIGDFFMATAVEKEMPPLLAGDKLTRAEFLRRWEAHPQVKKAELIGGIVYMPSPVTVQHGDTEGKSGTWLGVYSSATPGTASGHNTTSFLLEDIPQPDINLRILPEYGGRSWVEDKYLHGVPDLLVEVCRSSAAYDLHVKLDLYQAAQVPEYLAILLYEREIRWHLLTGATYQLMPPDPDGIWRSRIFPGLWLDGNALLGGDMPQVLAVLQQGLQSAEHEAFVEKLQEGKRAR
jgi:Uma2 family endonuclease